MSFIQQFDQDCLLKFAPMGNDPYVMIYEKPTAPPITRHLQRWVNNKRLFHAVQSFSDYEPVKKLLAGQEEMR